MSKIYFDIFFAPLSIFQVCVAPPPQVKSKVCTFRCVVPFGDVNILVNFGYTNLSLRTNLQSRHVFFYA